MISNKPDLLKNEKIAKIESVDDYYITTFGNVYSFKKGVWRKLSPFVGSNGRYYAIKLNGKAFLIHRLVAITFIPNPQNLPEVNHKDKNTLNPNVDNLEWCTRKDNLNDSYSTMSPVRNYNSCKLYCNNKLIGTFQSISKACRYAHKHYQVSEASLSKYLKCGEIKIVPVNNRRNCAKKRSKTYNKKDIKLYKDGFLKAKFSSFPEMSKYFKTTLGIEVSSDALRKRFYTQRIINGYEIKRN